MRQSLVETQTRFGGEQRHANLVGTDRGDVHLTAVAPVDFNEIRPRCYAIVAAKPETPSRPRTGSSPPALADANSVHPRQSASGCAPCGHPPQPLARERPDGGNATSPAQLDPGLGSPINQQLVKHGSTHTATGTVREAGIDRAIQSMNLMPRSAANWPGEKLGCRGGSDSESPERGHAVGHNAFAASFVDRRPGWSPPA